MKRLMALCGVVTLVAAFGCDDGAQGPTPDPPGAASPAEGLEAVELSFNQRDIKVLASALSENFIFYFDRYDVGQRLPGKPEYKIPASWSYDEFRPAAKNVFDDAYSINMSIPTGRVGTPAENETIYKAENISITLLVMVDELNGFIAEGYCNFEFERYEGAGGKKYWRLTRWWDRTSPGYDECAGATPKSIGKIFALYK